MTKTIILLAAIFGEPGTAPQMQIVQSGMTVEECENTQDVLRESLAEYTLMCATDEAVTTLLGQSTS